MTAKLWCHIVHLKGQYPTADIALAEFAADLQGLFASMAQAFIELAEAGADKRAILERIRNHLAAQGAAAAPRQEALLSE